MIALWRNNLWLRRLVMWVLIPIAAIYLWWQWMYPVAQFRYKLTVEVMTPDGLKTGSSVIEVRYSSVHPLPNPGRWSSDTITGEAVYVDLGGGKNLFVLLGADRWTRKASETPFRRGGFDGLEGSSYDKFGDDIYEQKLAEGSLNALWLPVHVFKLGRMPGYEQDMQKRADALLNQRAVDVPFLNLPLVGSFTDISKPETFEVLAPEEINKTLGEGHVLKLVKMQIVSEDVVARLESVLPWLSSGSSQRLRECKNSPGSKSLACQLGMHQFWAAESKPEYIEN